MLVKLGNVWVDPQSVIFISSNVDSISISVREDGYVGALPVMNASSLEESDRIKDEFASIINTSLTTQSFGGAEDERENPSVS